MPTSAKIILITNRNVNTNRNDHTLFGDDLNTIHNADLNIALAQPKTGKKWELSLLSDPTNPNYDQPQSETLFKKIVEETTNKKWVFFIHGFNQSLRKNLNKCKEIASYGANVVAFSWPSNPGPSGIFLKGIEYRKAQHNARQSTSALHRTIEKLHSYLGQYSADLNINLVVHSLGNYLFEEYVRTTPNLAPLMMFNNILLHEADVDHKGHTKWINRVTDHARTYITINEHDSVLNGSDIINKHRLGNTARKLNADEAIYINFTNGKEVRTSHRPWHKPAKKNPALKSFYSAVFTGQHGEKEKGWIYKSTSNCYALIKKEPLLLDSDYSE